MPRKRTKMPENYNKGFPSTLRKLMKEKGVTESELAEHIKKACGKEKLSRQAVSYYKDGSSSPDWETLVAIADYFGVSIDYLTGRTPDIKTSDIKIKKICEYTGLSDEAVRSLNGASTKNDGNRTRLQGLSQFFGWSKDIVFDFDRILYNAIYAPNENNAYGLNETFWHAIYEIDNQYNNSEEPDKKLFDRLRDLGVEIMLPFEKAKYWKERAKDTVSVYIDRIREDKLEKEGLINDPPQPTDDDVEGED